MSLRPRDQIALVRTHGRRVLVRAVEGSPERATRTVASRQRWMQNLSPDLNRVLDGRLSRTGLSLPTPRESLLEWTAQALRHGLHPLHAVQMLTRGGVPLAYAAQAVSLTRSVIRDPAKTAVWLTAKALGIPSLPVRLATRAFDLVRDVGQVLSR